MAKFCYDFFLPMQKCLQRPPLWCSSETIQQCQALGTFGIFVSGFNFWSVTILETLRFMYSCFLFNKSWGLYSVFLFNFKTLSNLCCFKSKNFGFEGFFSRCVCSQFFLSCIDSFFILAGQQIVSR